MTELAFQRLDPDAVLPERAHPGDAGFDLRSIEDVEVGPGERAMVRTGVAVAIPDGHAGLVLPRSGPHESVKIARGDRIAQLLVVEVSERRPGWVDELPPSSRGESGFGSTGRS